MKAMQPQLVSLRALTIRTTAIALLLLVAGCGEPAPPPTPPAAPPPQAAPAPQSSAPAKPAPNNQTAQTALPNGADPFEWAQDTALSAATLSQTAQSPDDWNLVSSKWQAAITQMKAVPATHPKKAQAQKKVAEYQRNLNTAKQKTKTSAIPGKLALAMHLKQAGAKMYGTYWCSTCQRQLYRFGSEAASQINYIECDPAGKNPQTDLCRQAKIRAFPTWEINGYLYPPGGLRLEALADYSGYQGPRNFTN